MAQRSAAPSAMARERTPRRKPSSSKATAMEWNWKLLSSAGRPAGLTEFIALLPLACLRLFAGLQPHPHHTANGTGWNTKEAAAASSS